MGRFPRFLFGAFFVLTRLLPAGAQAAPLAAPVPLAAPEVRLALNAEGLVVLESPGTDPSVRVSALVDLRHTPLYIPNIGRMEPLPPSAYAAVVWSSDEAGNYSDPLPVFLDFPPLKIENPLPGLWANRQRLVISGAENKRVLWTMDGGDPAGGLPYEGPVLIDRAGTVTLRIAALHEDGRVQEWALTYTVEEPRDDPLAGALEEIRAAEAGIIRTDTALTIPPAWFWSSGGPPRIPGGTPLVLRPGAGIRRTAPLRIAGTGGDYRFVFTLDGTGGEEPPRESLWDAPRGIYSLPGESPGQEGPRLVYAGSSRVLVWPRNRGPILRRWEGGASWEDGGFLTLVPPGGGILRWTAGSLEGGSPVYGLRIEAAARDEGAEEFSRGRYLYRSLAGGAAEAWNTGSPLMPYPGDAVPAVCDGEDLEWVFITREGRSLGSWRSDRLAPPAPGLIAPPEGAWVRGPVSLSIAGTVNDPGLESEIAAQVRYTSGRVVILRDRDTLLIPPPEEGTAEVRLEAQFVDAAGNRGPRALRNFTIDSAAIYVSALVRGSGQGSGSRDAPFRYLDEALDLARREGRRNIRVAGLTQLRRDAALSGDMLIEGGFDENWSPGDAKARIVIPGGAVFRVEEGNLGFHRVSLERNAGSQVLFRVEAGGTLTMEEVELTLAGPFLRLGELGQGRFSGLRLASLIGGGGRTPLVSAMEGHLEIRDSLFELEGEDGVLFDLRGGRFLSEGGDFRLKAQRTGTALILRGTRTEMTDTEVFAEAGDYACALDLRQAPVTVTRGSLGVAARDGVAAASDDSEGLYLGTAFRVKTSFVARAMEIRSRFPQVTDCRFTFTGTARQAEVFAGLPGEGSAGSIPLPGAGTIGGNVFSGFTHILGTTYPLESLAGFNRAFAPPGRWNTDGEGPR